MRRTAWALGLLALWAMRSMAAEGPEVLLTLEALAPLHHGEAAGLPMRFALLDDGQVFVGGTAEVWTGRLDKDELRALEDRIEGVRKLPDLAGKVVFGPGPGSWRLRLRKAKLPELFVAGDPKAAAPVFSILASLVADLDHFDHPSLKPFVPERYVLAARSARLPGGCRAWSFPVSLAQVLGGPREVPASAAVRWPTGGNPASVCDGEQAYVVTLRPLLPFEGRF